MPDPDSGPPGRPRLPALSAHTPDGGCRQPGSTACHWPAAWPPAQGADAARSAGHQAERLPAPACPAPRGKVPAPAGRQIHLNGATARWRLRAAAPQLRRPSPGCHPAERPAYCRSAARPPARPQARPAALRTRAPCHVWPADAPQPDREPSADAGAPATPASTSRSLSGLPVQMMQPQRSQCTAQQYHQPQQVEQ